MEINKYSLSFIHKLSLFFKLLFCINFLFFSFYVFSEELSFEEIINFAGIQKFNVNGEIINEDIYRKYNTFVYSDPVSLLNRTSLQRFKEVAVKGKTIYNQKQGEFYILGTNYNGEFVYNVYFPVDVVPESMPETWDYLYYNSFEKSWEENYDYIEQKEYMQNTKLMFDRIDLEKKTADSYDLIEYNLVPKIIGLGKFRLNTSATWKTMGIVTAKRRLKNGMIRDVIFKTSPIAADASIKSYINANENLEMNENEDEKNIEIEFGAQVVNLSKYAKAEHIKNIESVIYINGEYVDKISGSKMINVDKKINFIISRDESLINGGILNYKIEIKSMMCTSFKADGVIYEHIIKDLTVKIAPKKLVPIKSMDLKLLYINSDSTNIKESKEKNVYKHIDENFKNKNTNIEYKHINNLVVSPLVQTYSTKFSNSCGIIERGRNLALFLSYGVPLKYIENIEVYLNNEKLEYEYIKNLEEYGIVKIKSDNAKITIASWFYLREKLGSYFKIESSDIGKRIDIANIIKVLVYLNVNDICYEYFIEFDAIDDYIKNINYEFKDYILNYDELKEKTALQKW